MGSRNEIWGIGQVRNALAIGVIAGGLIALAGGAGAADSVVDPSDTPIFLPDPPQNGTVCSGSANGDDFTYALPGPAVTQDEKSAWVARFVVPEWKGQLRRVDIADNSQDKTHSIPQPDQREIITFSPVEGAGVPFRWDSLTSEQQTALQGDGSQGNSGQGNSPGQGNKSTGELRLEYLRGSHAEEKRNGGDFRNREIWELGDTVHSRPVIVGSPSFLYPDENLGSDGHRYSDFQAAHADREPLVFVGANDGMLHAFYSKDPDGDGGIEAGQEAFAYVPGERFREAVGGGGLIFAYSDDQQLGTLVQEDGENTLKDLTDSGNKDTKHISVVGPAADFDGDGKKSAVYTKTQSQIRVLEEGSGKASVKISLKGDKARTSKSRLAVGSFSGDNPKIYYANAQENRIYEVSHENGQWQDPVELFQHGDGTNAVSGFGDIDGDGRNELVYADASQDPHFVEQCDIDVTVDCDNANIKAGDRRFYKPGGTPGSNNGIGYGNLFDYKGTDVRADYGEDTRATEGLLVTSGSNNIWVYYPKEPGSSSGEGAHYAPNTPSPEPHDQVEKGTKLTENGPAAKSPLTAADVDGDGNMEVVFPSSNVNNNLAPLKKLDGDGTISTISSKNYDPVRVRDETGVTGGDVGGGGGTGSDIYDQLPKLTKLGYSHQYFIDGSPTYADAYFSGKGKWRSVVVTPFGRGHYQGIFALDVTKVSQWATDSSIDIEDDKAGDIPLWQFGDTEHNGVGHVVNKVSIVRLNNGDWAVAFGNGFGNRKEDGHQSPTGDARVFLVDVETGELIRTISTKEGFAEDPTTNAERGNALGPVAPVDTDGDAIADYIYAGDLFGNLWKFDLTSSNSDEWHIVGDRGNNQAGKDPKTPLFSAESDAGNPQPITVRPVVNDHPVASESGLMIYFGTGKYIERGDHSQSGETTQSLYGLWDPLNGESTSYDRSFDRFDLLEQEIELETTKTVDGESFDVRVVTDNAIDWTEHNGWYLDLIEGASNDGERLVASPQLRDGALLFNTIIPRVPRECGKTNKGWLIKLEAANGSRTQAIPFDLDGDSSFGEAERVDVNGQSKHISGAKTQTGSSTGGVGAYVVPGEGSQSIKSEHPGSTHTDDQRVDKRKQNTRRGSTGRQYWQQLR